MAEDSIARRSFLKGAGAAGAAAAAVITGGPPEPAQAQSASPGAEPEPAITEPYLILTAAEAAFLSAAYDTFIPADALSPSGTDCGLVTYMDRQLAGAWGNGAHIYRAGPFIEGKPEQGYRRRSRGFRPGRAAVPITCAFISRRPHATEHQKKAFPGSV